MSRNKTYIKYINSKEWKSLRIKKLINTPICECCEKDGRITVATEVHHITPVESVASATQMKQLMFNYSNLMSVCHACHSDIHRKMFSHSKAAIKANNKRITETFVDKFLK